MLLSNLVLSKGKSISSNLWNSISSMHPGITPVSFLLLKNLIFYISYFHYFGKNWIRSWEDYFPQKFKEILSNNFFKFIWLKLLLMLLIKEIVSINFLLHMLQCLRYILLSLTWITECWRRFDLIEVLFSHLIDLLHVMIYWISLEFTWILILSIIAWS